jgi:hypothetical protein
MHDNKVLPSGAETNGNFLGSWVNPIMTIIRADNSPFSLQIMRLVLSQRPLCLWNSRIENNGKTTTWIESMCSAPSTEALDAPSKKWSALAETMRVRLMICDSVGGGRG